MNYIKFGKGERTMVILPGLSLKPVTKSAASVKSAYDCFNKDYTVYLFDRRSDIADSYSIDEMAEDTIAMFKELGPKDIYLFGVSQGGMIAQVIALKAPELIRKMVLASTTSAFKTGAAEEWLSFVEEKDAKKLTQAFAKMIYTPGTYKKYKPFLALIYKDMNEEDLRKFSVYAKACIDFDVTDRLNEIGIPTLVLGSRDDKLITVEEMELLQDKLPDGEIYLYDGYGHAVYDEAPDFKNRIMEFYAKNNT